MFRSTNQSLQETVQVLRKNRSAIRNILHCNLHRFLHNSIFLWLGWNKIKIWLCIGCTIITCSFLYLTALVLKRTVQGISFYTLCRKATAHLGKLWGVFTKLIQTVSWLKMWQQSLEQDNLQQCQSDSWYWWLLLSHLIWPSPISYWSCYWSLSLCSKSWKVHWWRFWSLLWSRSEPYPAISQTLWLSPPWRKTVWSLQREPLHLSIFLWHEVLSVSQRTAC